MKKLIVLVNFFFLLPHILLGQTGGPGQPEFMQFQQAGTSNLVNPSTGTFSYQIPLFSIGGYPMNLTYQSGIQMEDVASMVGLGWNLNAGSIVRTLRGMPDDFNGDNIIKQYSVNPNETYGGKFDLDMEIAGLPHNLGLAVSGGLGIFYNNYKGWGLEPSIGATISKSTEGNGGSASLGMGISVNSQSGVDKYLSPSLGLKLGKGDNKLSVSLGHTWAINSNEGLKQSTNTSLSFVRYTANKQKKPEDKGTENKSGSDQSSMSLLGLSTASYLNNSFQPDIEYPFENISGTYSGTVGWDAFYVDPSIRVTGYFSKQTLTTKTQYIPAIGLMYETANNPADALLDFNREKKLPYFIGQSKILPIPYKTPDVFNLNAQGLSMSFSVCKNDIGVVGDAQAVINSNGTQAGAEVNLGELFKAGANFGTTTSFQQTETWNPTNLRFEPDQTKYNTGLYQQFSFKNHGEINRFDHTAFNTMGGYDPVYFALANEKSILNHFVNNTRKNVLNNFNEIGPGAQDHVNKNQPVHQSTINYLNAKEASQIGFDKEIQYYRFDNVPYYSAIQYHFSRDSAFRKDSHLSEISATQSDGMKYVFGIPVYNTTQKEVSFNVGVNPKVNMATNLVRYFPSRSDNTVDNSNGIDHFFESTITPAYATQFLVTAVLSPDYRDITNDGITDDDFGNYVKFSYFKEDFIYKWRTPAGKDSATYNRGLRSDDQDDKGSYVYGEKELWYVRSMESRTEIAEFYYSMRVDGYGVNDENGGINTNLFTRKLDSVVVYSLLDRRKNGANAVPIKIVHFEYSDPNNSLCKFTPNCAPSTGTGKLTLHKVDFTYERSDKGRLTPYVFEYGINPTGSVVNPNYHARDVNCWGYYQQNPANAYSDCDNSKALSNVDFPYASQDKSTMDGNAFAWNLSNITIPGGGKLRVDYEAHDYGYIQNMTAGQMFPVSGLGTTDPTGINAISGNSLYPTQIVLPPLNSQYNYRIYFKLTTSITSKRELEEQYIKDIKDGYLYYKFYVTLKGLAPGSDNQEYVTGYVKITDYNIIPGNSFAYVEFEPVNINDENIGVKCNPILKTALQYMRINRNNLLFDNTNAIGQPADISSFIEQLPSVLYQLGDQISASTMGVNLFCSLPPRNYCFQIDKNKSFIRLYNPGKNKIAGGSRVKQISINDDWDAMAGNTYQSKGYTTSYNYTTQETNPVTNAKTTISSGVAEYEPMVGGDQNPLKQPIFYSDIKKFAPDNDYYVETPVNESLFPAPQITYGKVTQITNETTLNIAKSGKIVNEFFTANDYPVNVNMTVLDLERKKTDFSKFQDPFIAIDQAHDFASVSQGYSIILNNMSGLPKSTTVYNQNGDRISGEEFEYFSNNDSFSTISKSGDVNWRNQQLGLSVEYTVDGRRSYDKSVASTVNANLNLSMVGVAPALVVMPLFSKMTEEKQFQSLVVNKVIHRNGLLKRKTVFEQTSSVSTENIAFDEVTGEAILTKTTNEFNDSLYSFKYPAYWMYDGMGPSYSNTKLNINSSNYQTFKQFLKVGDELRRTSSSTGNPARLWVFAPNSNPPKFETDDKTVVTSLPDNYQVYNSGAKNLLSSSAGQVVTWKYNPILGLTKLTFDATKILNSSAIQYYDDAVTYCDSCDQINKRLGKNIYLLSKKGIWKPKRTWFYLEERTPKNLANGITNIKEQGLFNKYNDFWTVPTAPYTYWRINGNNWEWKEKVNLTDVEGQTIETQDRIGRKVANLLGYKNTLITAQANNAGYNEIFFDGFEDYYCAFCPYLHYGKSANTNSMFRANVVSGDLIICDSQAHTGKYSLSVSGSFTFTTFAPTECKPAPTIADAPAALDPELEKATAIILQSNQEAASQSSNATAGNTLQTGQSGQGSYRMKVTGKDAKDTSCSGCVGGFSPVKNKKYIFSCWVKVNNPQPILSNNDASVVITCNGTTPVTLHPEGPVIEDWQRVTGEFSTSHNSNAVTVMLNAGNAISFYDDIRIFPTDGNMVSYVYDDVNLRLTYSLDENNYYTKNEYNNQGELIRIKKETERGIVTIKEGNQSLIKQSRSNHH